MLIVPLTSIKHQLLDDCVKMGISVLDGDQVVKVTHSAQQLTVNRLISRVPFISSGKPTWNVSC